MSNVYYAWSPTIGVRRNLSLSAASSAMLLREAYLVVVKLDRLVGGLGLTVYKDRTGVFRGCYLTELAAETLLEQRREEARAGGRP